MSLRLKVTHIFNGIFITVSVMIFKEIEKLILEFIWDNDKTRKAKIIQKKVKHDWRINIS